MSAETQVDTKAEAAITPPKITRLTVLYHRDLTRIGDAAALPLDESKEPIEVSRLTPSFSTPGTGGIRRRPLGDPYLSRSPLLLRAVGDEVEIDVSGTRTAVWLGDLQLVGSHRLAADLLDDGVVLRLAKSIVLLLHRRESAPQRTKHAFGLVGESDALLRVRRDIEHVAELDVPVILLGETGTGKELVASAIHNHSSRHDGALVAINMAAVAPNLAAAELFGAARGAYTGSVRVRQGYFRRADGGTLFLDEVGDTPNDVQPLLLRALESGDIQEVGGENSYRVDVRLIAATDTNLASKAARGQFKAPLLHRLSGYEIRLPPLRNRLEDLSLLIMHFLHLERDELSTDADTLPGGALPGDRSTGGRAHGSDIHRWLSAKTIARLAEYHWPGNVRELRNVVRQLAITGRNAPQTEVDRRLEQLITASDEPSPADQRQTAPAAPTEASTGRETTYRRPSEVDDEELLEALRQHRWLIQPTARTLGLSRTSLYGLIQRSDRVRKPSDLSRQELERAIAEHGGDLDAMIDALEVSGRGIEQRLRQLSLMLP